MYTVPIIPPDLRHEETIIQAANALNCLQKTINSVFERIDDRISKNNAKAQDLGARIARAQAKIHGLVGTKKAIKIYAPARFPSSGVFHDIPQTFGTMSEESTKKQQQQQKPQYEVLSRVEAPTIQSPNEKLIFFHVRSETAAKTSAADHCQGGSGLGGVPEQLRSVNSLLLAASNYEPVYGVVHIDRDYNGWKRAKLFKNQRQNQSLKSVVAQKQLLEPAPHSLLAANRLQQQTPAGGLGYTPKLHEAPEIDLPLDLPDLPGIADDIHYEGKETQQQIAPSLYAEQLPELPELLQAAEIDESQKKVKIDTEVISNIPAKSVETKYLAVPPPPPPPPPAMAPPPPPPPPPPTAITAPTVAKINQNPPDTRSELMDAIRKAGGVGGGGLRAAAPVDSVDSHTSANDKPKPAGNLMADLHNKLMMRRKGISGTKANDNDNTNSSTSAAAAVSSSNNAVLGNPVISRLSALIPPPKPHSEDDDDDDADMENDTEWVD